MHNIYSKVFACIINRKIVKVLYINQSTIEKNISVRHFSLADSNKAAPLPMWDENSLKKIKFTRKGLVPIYYCRHGEYILIFSYTLDQR